MSLTARNREYGFTISDLVTDSSPLATVRASGAFTRLDRSDLAGITTGARFTSVVTGESGEVLGIGRAEPDMARIGAGEAAVPAMVEGKVQLPATLRIRCSFTGADCRVWTTPLGRNASIGLTIGGHQYAFVIAELAPDTVESKHEARVAVRFVMRPEVDGLVKPGDVDTRTPPSPNAFQTDSARVTAVGSRQERSSLSAITSGDATFQMQEPVVLTEVTLSVPVTETAGAWYYKGQAIRAGGAIVFETVRYTVRGAILSVSIDPASTTGQPKR
jgi:hypothetical protein